MTARVKHSHNYEQRNHTHAYTQMHECLLLFMFHFHCLYSLAPFCNCVFLLFASCLVTSVSGARCVLTRPVFNVSPGLTRLPFLSSFFSCFLYVWQRINFKCPVEATKCIRVCASQMKCPAGMGAGAGAAIPGCPTCVCVRECVKANQQNSK